MRFLLISLLAVLLATTIQGEVFKKEKVTLGKAKCVCDFNLNVGDKCTGKGKCDKKCTGSGTVELGGCSFTLKVKKGKGAISKCQCEAKPTGTGTGSGEGPVTTLPPPGSGSGSGEQPVTMLPPPGSGSGPVTIPPSPGSGSGPIPPEGEGMKCSCKCNCPDGSGECDCDCNCPMTSTALNCASGFSKVCPMMGEVCPEDMEQICPMNAESRMGDGNGIAGTDKGCQCVPDFLMALVAPGMPPAAGRLGAVDRAMTKATIQVGNKKCKCSYEMNADNCKKSKIICDKKCSGKAQGVEVEDGMYVLDIAVKKGKVTIAKCDVQATETTGTGSGSGGGGMGSGSGNAGGGVGGMGSKCACVSKGMVGSGPPTGGPEPTLGPGSGFGSVIPTEGPEPTPGTGSGSGSGSPLCPEERPEFGSSCNVDRTCYYGNQTCCGESMAEYVMECGGGEWNGYFIDTVCILGGPCPSKTTEPSCICPAVFSPVCGSDGQTYSNTCQADCGGAQVGCQGECPCPSKTTEPSCICPEVFSPVCGSDGQTYSNTCQADCGGAQVGCQGECPCQ